MREGCDSLMELFVIGKQERVCCKCHRIIRVGERAWKSPGSGLRRNNWRKASKASRRPCKAAYCRECMKLLYFEPDKEEKGWMWEEKEDGLWILHEGSEVEVCRQ